MKWKRLRFTTHSEDYRPIVFNPKYPWWCSGESENDATIIAFLPTTEDLETYWPEANDVEEEEVDKITFSDRFPKPAYFKD